MPYRDIRFGCDPETNMLLKTSIAAGALCGALLLAHPAAAAGCIKGAIVGGIAAHMTHHSTLLGALGGCIVGKVVAHYTGSLSFDEVTGKMLGSDADLGRVAKDGNVSIVKVSSLKGFRRGDVPVAGNAAVSKLDGEIAADANLSGALSSAGYKPQDVLAVSAKGGGVVFVNA
jgi:hypothetical protein